MKFSWNEIFSRSDKEHAPVCGEYAQVCDYVASGRAQLAEEVKAAHYEIEATKLKLALEQEGLNKGAAQLSQWKAGLDAREQNLNTREQKLHALESAFKTREMELKKQEHSLNNREQQLNFQDRILKEKERVLDHTHQQLTAHQLVLDQNERRQKENEIRLDQKNAVLQDNIRRLQVEREQWAAACPVQKQDGLDTKEALGAARDAFVGITKEMNQTKEKLLELIKAVNNSDQDGVEALCELYLDMFLAKDAFADTLGALLQREFHAEALEPCPGDRYDSEYHERLDMSQTGDRVSCCRVRGWQRMGQVIRRAVVETE